ncbi:MAG: GDP-mannose 4,6-dehydratase [Calditrichia bacterium]
MYSNVAVEGIRKFILASTSSIYGETETPFNVGNKTDTPHFRRYAASKKGAEALCYSYHYLYKIDEHTAIFYRLRIRQDDDMSYFKFLLKIDRGLANRYFLW